MGFEKWHRSLDLRNPSKPHGLFSKFILVKIAWRSSLSTAYIARAWKEDKRVLDRETRKRRSEEALEVAQPMVTSLNLAIPRGQKEDRTHPGALKSFSKIVR